MKLTKPATKIQNELKESLPNRADDWKFIVDGTIDGESIMLCEGWEAIEFSFQGFSNKDLKDVVKKLIAKYGDQIENIEMAILYNTDEDSDNWVDLDRLVEFWSK